MTKTYLGDGVYVEFDDEYELGLVLTTEDNRIYINESVYENLLRFVAALKALRGIKKNDEKKS